MQYLGSRGSTSFFPVAILKLLVAKSNFGLTKQIFLQEYIVWFCLSVVPIIGFSPYFKFGLIYLFIYLFVIKCQIFNKAQEI